MNVTAVPAQMVLVTASEAMDTLAGSIGLTVTGIPLEVVGEPVRQGEALEVITTVTIAPFARLEAVYVEPVLLPGAFTPLIFHW